MARVRNFYRVEDVYSRHADEMDRVEHSVLLILLVAAVGVLISFNWTVLP